MRLVTSAVAFGEGIHQYQRNLYLARLDDAGVELSHHLRPVSVRAGHGDLRERLLRKHGQTEGVDTLVVTRRPDGRRRASTSSCEGSGVPVERAGDCLGPRSFEEAIREGTLAGLRP